MTTRVHKFVPVDARHVPTSNNVSTTLTWLQSNVDAYQIEAVQLGHITFFDCGGGLDLVACPHCRRDIGGPLWKDWMDESCTLETGFTLTERLLPCCRTSVRLDQLYFDPLCAFGSFAIEITDTMKTWLDDEFAALQVELAKRLSCALQRIDAQY
jgi:hypothetical protein